MKRIALSVFFTLLISWSLNAQVTMQKEEGGLLFLENGEKVLFYQADPKNYEGEYERCNYIHPLWGVDGEVLTEDFPIDHLHHRGIFWAWHQVWIDGKRIGDPWEIKDFNQKVTDIEFWAQKDGSALLKTKVNWLSDQWKKNGKKVPYLEESTNITIHPETGNYRRIDFEISLQALEDGLSIGGSEDEKGYSGFSVRMVLPDDFTFFGPNGKVKPENTAVESPGYINISGSIGKSGKNAGIVILDNPSNPGFPQPWILRAKNSMQNAAFPGNGTVPVLTSVPLVLKYSLLVYSGKMNDRKIRKVLEN
ncbi:PmoA family protein [Mariniphaga sp.]|uniref:DUF6807 domain-containing protein n=1 Tax=Mariniphaga sp. TaxID=1954475 RepID=UPI003568D5E2